MQQMQEKLIKRWTIHSSPIPFKMMENSFVSFFAAVINQNMCRGRQLSAKSSVVINTLIHVSLHVIPLA